MSTTVETDGPARVGTRVVERRNIPGRPRDFSYEITELDPPRKTSFRGTAGPVRPAGTYTVDPTDVNFALRVEATAANRFGSAVAKSTLTASVTPPHDPRVQ